ncbi:MAG TPA: ACT domain-containing protein, partial [Propionibacteriaceae bacterium]|nr:ACT domain-containing protein [Propionibacteriaceae bacterium]
MTQVVLTAIGDDRAGLVSALADAVASEGGNWLESQMARLGGKFAGVVLVDVPEDRFDGLTAALEALSTGHVLDVTVTRADATPTPSGTRLALHL